MSRWRGGLQAESDDVLCVLASMPPSAWERSEFNGLSFGRLAFSPPSGGGEKYQASVCGESPARLQSEIEQLRSNAASILSAREVHPVTVGLIECLRSVLFEARGAGIDPDAWTRVSRWVDQVDCALSARREQSAAGLRMGLLQGARLAEGARSVR